MKVKNIIYILCLSAIFWACQSKTDKQVPDTETHEHGADCDHDHSKDHNHPEGHDDHNHDHSHDHDHGTKQEVESAHDDDEIVFTLEQAKSVGLELETVKPGDFYQVIKTSGQILSAQGDEATVAATMSGIVSFNKPSLNEGMAIRAGESLLSISSKNIVDGDPIMKAKNAFEITKREFERAESLIKDRLISEIEYNEAKLNYENARVSYSSFSRNQTAKGSSMSSPIGGFIKTKLVNEGEYVEVGQALLTVTQNKKLKLRADVSERYYNSLSGITSANFKTPYDDNVFQLSDMNGRLTSYGRSVSNDDYYIPVNFEFDNIGQIIPGSFVDVYLLSGKKANTISVPISALIEDQGVYFVFVQLDAEGYKKVEVKTGSNDGSRVEILSGLTIGKKVVSKGAIHVKLASTSSDIPHGHEH